MLTLEACRELLGDEAPADERELEARRDHAYRLARLLIEIYREQKASRNLPSRAPNHPQI
jgi:hypothetical protein